MTDLHPPPTTSRLTLRDFTAGDFEALYETTKHPAYRRFYSEEEMSRKHWEGCARRADLEAAFLRPPRSMANIRSHLRN